MAPAWPPRGPQLVAPLRRGGRAPTGRARAPRAPPPFLDGKHTIFGRVCAGMPVVKRLGTVMTDANDRPTQEVTLQTARVVDG